MNRELYQCLSRFSDTDSGQLGQIWNGTHPEDGPEVQVDESTEIEGGAPVDSGHGSAASSPDWDMAVIMAIAQQIHQQIHGEARPR